MDPADPNPPTILVAGASRGLGAGLASEFARRGWRVVGTVRDGSRSPLHDLAEMQDDRIEVAALDVTVDDSIKRLRDKLSGRRLDVLFINAGTTTRDGDAPMGTVPTEEFVRVMSTNAHGPMRVIEALQDLVPADGLIGAMSSGQGSIANNTQGQRDLYRASKAALNMAMRSFAAREAAAARAMLLLAPGWIRTDLGGPDAPYSLDESVPLLADIVLGKRARPGLEYLDRFGRAVPW